jgi:hypothetical protein
MKTLQILEYGRGLRASKKTVIGCGEDENQIGGGRRELAADS